MQYIYSITLYPQFNLGHHLPNQSTNISVIKYIHTKWDK